MFCKGIINNSVRLTDPVICLVRGDAKCIQHVQPPHAADYVFDCQ